MLDNYFICSIFMMVTTKETILFHNQEREGFFLFIIVRRHERVNKGKMSADKEKPERGQEGIRNIK